MSTATKPKPIPERVALLPEIELKSGKHSAPDPTCTHPAGCAEEIESWALGQDWTDRSPWKSPAIAAFRRRLNDGLPLDLRQKLKEETMFMGIGTAGDGRDEDRAWMITDWSIRVALPTWLELAGVEDTPKQLRAFPEVTAETFGEVRPLVYKLRDEAWERRKEWRANLREAVKAELKKRGLDKPDAAAAAVAVADAVADAVAAAAAVAVADAVADAVAVAVAVADADAVADAAADAVAVADAAAVAVAEAAAAAVEWRPGLYSAVYNKVKPIYVEKFGEKYEPTQTELLGSALDLIKRMSELEPAE